MSRVIDLESVTDTLAVGIERGAAMVGVTPRHFQNSSTPRADPSGRCGWGIGCSYQSTSCGTTSSRPPRKRTARSSRAYAGNGGGSEVRGQLRVQGVMTTRGLKGVI